MQFLPRAFHLPLLYTKVAGGGAALGGYCQYLKELKRFSHTTSIQSHLPTTCLNTEQVEFYLSASFRRRKASLFCSFPFGFHLRHPGRREDSQ